MLIHVTEKLSNFPIVKLARNRFGIDALFICFGCLGIVFISFDKIIIQIKKKNLFSFDMSRTLFFSGFLSTNHEYNRFFAKGAPAHNFDYRCESAIFAN